MTGDPDPWSVLPRTWDFLHAIVALFRQRQMTALFSHKNPEMLGMSTMSGAMAVIVDNILLLNWVELGDTFRLGLTIAKVRAMPTSRATYECEIVDGQGLYVLPRAVPVPQLPFARYYMLAPLARRRKGLGHGSTQLARSPAPSPATRLLDRWPRDGADALACRRPPPSRLGATANAPDPGPVRCSTEYLPALERDGWWALVPIWGSGADAESAPSVATGRAALGARPVSI
jgi:hypothetical protein